jgi:hypothetical protein
MEAPSIKQGQLIMKLGNKAPNLPKIAQKYGLNLYDFDHELNSLTVKQASALIQDLIADTQGNPSVAARKKAGAGKILGGDWKSKPATQKQVGYALALMAQLGFSNWHKLNLSEFPKPPKTSELMKMTAGQVSTILDALNVVLGDSYA